MTDFWLWFFTLLVLCLSLLSFLVNLAFRSKNVLLKDFLLKKKWDYITTKIMYSYKLINDREIILTKEIEAKPLKNIPFFYGTLWRNNQLVSIEFDNPEYSFEILNEKDNKIEYKIIPKIPLKLNESYRYMVTFITKQEDYRSTIPYLSINITRPTKSVILLVEVPSSIKLRNVHLKKERENTQISIVPSYAISDNNCTRHTFTINKPEINTKYSIGWEWADQLSPG